MSTLPARTADMQALPSLEAFAKRYEAGEAQVVWTRLVADLETPVSVYLKLAQGKPLSFLLELVEGGAARGRYSVIGLEPDVVWRANGEAAEINRSPAKKPEGVQGAKRSRRSTSLRALPGRVRASSCRRSCRPWRPACSATWATTRCA